MRISRWYLVPVILAALASVALLAAACDSNDEDTEDGEDGSAPTATQSAGGGETAEPTSDDGGGSATVDVEIEAFEVRPSVDTAAAGEVTFNVTNVGSRTHNLTVVKTDLDPADLPLNESGSAVDETQVDIVGATSDISGGDGEELTLTLEPGSYVLICNITGHYEAGMRAAFTVE